MTLDGGDRKVAYTIPPAPSPMPEGQTGSAFLGDQLIAMYCRMNEGGAFDTRMVRVDETGEQELFTGTMEQLPSWLGAVTRYEDMGGDTALYFYLDDRPGEFGPAPCTAPLRKDWKSWGMFPALAT